MKSEKVGKKQNKIKFHLQPTAIPSGMYPIIAENSTMKANSF